MVVVNIICGDHVVDGLVVEPVWLHIPAYLNGCYALKRGGGV